MKNVKLTNQELLGLLNLVSQKQEESKEGTKKEEFYNRLGNKLWEVYSENK
ncbi:MAG: hypothetical protein Unbinned221contig1000_23 [Prokaryotic dsDNA virus sp.]|nr:MAG: hypothetical protein Unbinned221contig1000_23 [Prokaryotic dsDNA virus sp.]|tara:strand:+ start:2655 stop:2807 length:153 start_codon:yes stop_codon:yes gene_type:complete